MNEIQYISGYQNQPARRNALNELIQRTFGFSFEVWYQRGFWGDDYTSFSCLDGEKIVANAAAYLMELSINGRVYRTAQIGAVATHPDYKGRGLAAQLMRQILDTYRDKVDFFSLSANETVVNFYPRFGFRLVPQAQFSAQIAQSVSQRQDGSVKLNIHDEADWALMRRLVKNRIPLSNVLNANRSDAVFFWHVMYVHAENVWYLPEKDVLLVYRHAGSCVHLYDVVSEKPVAFQAILPYILTAETHTLRVHFTPDALNINVQAEDVPDEGFLFVSGDFPLEHTHFRFPAMSYT